MKRLYFISGLGADEQAFQKLDECGVPKVMVKWLASIPEESLLSYSKRIINKYGITKEDIVVGLSFGGLLAQQIAELLNHNYVILISSFRTKADLRLLFDTGLQFKLHRLVPEVKLTLISEIVATVLNSGTSSGKPILKKMIETTDMKLLKWSLEKIFEQDLELGQAVIKYNLIGNKDRVIKTWKNGNTYTIRGGSHFMVFDKAKEISGIINSIIITEEQKSI